MKNLVIIVVLVIIAAGGYWLLNSSQQPSQIGQTDNQPDAMMADETNNSASDNQTNTQATDNQDDSTFSSRYVDYSDIEYDQSTDQKRVLFFHANWCPTCKAANSAFEENMDQIPANVKVFKTDYDTQTELKNQYGITYQHTFVQVDSQGNEIAKWNGGDVEELLANLK